MMVRPDTVHTGGVPEANDTASPEVADADADNVTGAPTAASGGWLKAIVCDLRPAWTGNERATSRAAAKTALPPCEAVITHAPAATVVTVEPDTVHTSGVPEANDTASPDDAGADNVTCAVTATSGGCMKAIVCGFFPVKAAVTQARCTCVVGLVPW